MVRRKNAYVVPMMDWATSLSEGGMKSGASPRISIFKVGRVLETNYEKVCRSPGRCFQVFSCFFALVCRESTVFGMSRIQKRKGGSVAPVALVALVAPSCAR